MNKKGSQIGMIMSFTLFVVSLIFIYTIVGSPIKKVNQKQDSLSIVQDNALRAIKSQVILERVYSNGGNCLSVSVPSNSYSSLQAISVSNNARVGSYLDTSSVRVENSTGELKIYYSEPYFNQNPTCSTTCSSGSCIAPAVSSIVKENVYVEKLILNVINQTEYNYTNYSNVLGVPGGYDYAVLFQYQNGTIIGKNVDSSIKTSIYSLTQPITYLDLNGLEKRGNLIVKIW